MKIRLVSHASVIIRCGDTQIWTDPWLFGKVFNDSWTLFPEASFDPSLLSGIDYIWLSHEHPDHFHIPTLNSLPDDFKHRVTILFQSNGSHHAFKALEKIGYLNYRVLPHRTKIALTPQTRVYCYRVGTLDSALGVMSGDRTLFNVNDCRINDADCRTVSGDLGPIDVVLNQFSLAVYNGFDHPEEYLARGRRRVLEKLSANHRGLHAKVTIPFASLMYFSSVDNRYMNEFHNRPRDVFNYVNGRGQQCAVLYPGDTYTAGEAYDSGPALKRYDELWAGFPKMDYDSPPQVPLEQIRDAFHTLARHLRDKYPMTLLRLLRPVVVRINDLDKTIVFSIPAGTLAEAPGRDPDLIISGQSLFFCFARPHGLQTLASAACHRVLKDFRNWRMHRALFALNSAEVYLRPRFVLSRKNLAYFRDRIRGFTRYNDMTLAR